MKKLLKKIYGKGNKKEVKKLLRKMKRKEKMMVMMANITAIHSVVAVLNMPQSKAKRIVRAKEIVKACTNNANVAVSISVINTINGLITAYANSESDAGADAYGQLRNALRSVMSMFQNAANNDIFHAAGIIQSGKFMVKKVGFPQKRKFAAKNSGVGGEVILVAGGGKHNTCHDWQMSLDGVTFTRLAPTIAGKTKVKKLVRGTEVWFTHELVTRKGGQGVSQMIRLLVD